jgi:uroporphyrinogen decarboxylase
MNSRERVLTALEHKEPDRVPLDLGSCFVSGIAKDAYLNLMNHLNEDAGEIEFYDTVQQLVVVKEEILRRFGVDVRGLIPNVIRKDPPDMEESSGPQSFTDEWGVTWAKPESSLYFDLVESPLSGSITEEDIDNFPWPDPADPKLFHGLEEKAREYHENGYAVILESICAGLFEMSCRCRGTQYFLMDMALNPDLACKLMDKFVDIKIQFYKAASEKLGKYIQFVREGDDVAGQESLLMSPDMYRRLLKPRHRKIFDAQRKIFPQPFYIFFHSDGQVYDLLPDFIEIGMDILNPVQVTGKSMDTIKREFGSSISLWGGGCDTQRVLPFGTPDEVRADVRQRVEHLSPGGGFVFCTIHNIQADVAPENVIAMYDELKRRGDR